ncbi:MAG: hypothetical protein ABI585_00695 [Betaproteobacteria bacterium]
MTHFAGNQFFVACGAGAAAGPSIPVPANSPLGLALIALLFAAGAVVAIRRQRAR